MAGRIQLTTRGVQDAYFTEDPDYSYFVQLFKKHTNYASNYVKLDIDNEAEFGKTIRLTIPKDQGDLLIGQLPHPCTQQGKVIQGRHSHGRECAPIQLQFDLLLA